jgi:hypothetical protein
MAHMTFVSLVLPGRLAHMPDSIISLPNREYWLVPERRAATFERFGGHLGMMGCATVALLLAIFELVYRANIASVPLPAEAVWTLLVAFVVFTLGWTLWLLRSFRQPDQVPGAERQRTDHHGRGPVAGR